MRWLDVYSDLDFREVLVAVWLLDDEYRREQLLEHGRDLRMGYYVNFAFNAPKELSAEDRKYQSQLVVPASRHRQREDTAALQDAKAQLRAAGRL